MKKKKQQTQETILQQLFNNLVNVDNNIDKADHLEIKIRARIDNCSDDSIKVTRAMNNAKAKGAYSDASILEGKLRDIESDKIKLQRDYDNIASHNRDLKKMHDELVQNIEAIRATQNDIDMTYERAKLQNISNISYNQAKAMDSNYEKMRADAIKELDKAVSLKEMDSNRMLEELERKYTN